jgi:type IV secretory pathway component VirB8
MQSAKLQVTAAMVVAVVAVLVLAMALKMARKGPCLLECPTYTLFQDQTQ